MTAVFTDTGAGSVRLTVDAGGLAFNQDYGVAEFISGLYFNTIAGVDANLLSFALSGNQGYVSLLRSGNAAASARRADGDGVYDFVFTFDTSAAGDRFQSGDSFVIDITGDGISSQSFYAVSEPFNANAGTVPYYSAAHVQGIVTAAYDPLLNNTAGGWIAPVPLPAPFWLLVSTLPVLRRR